MIKKLLIIIAAVLMVVVLGDFVYFLNNTNKNLSYNEVVFASRRDGAENTHSFYKRDYDGKSKLLFNPKDEFIKKAGFDFSDINKGSIVVCEDKKRIFFYINKAEAFRSFETSHDTLLIRHDYYMMDFDSKVFKLASTYDPATVLVDSDCKYVVITVFAQVEWFGVYEVDKIEEIVMSSDKDESSKAIDHMLSRLIINRDEVEKYGGGDMYGIMLYPVKWSNKKPKAFFAGGEVYREGKPNTEGLWLVEFDESDKGGYSQKQTLILPPGEVFYGIGSNDKPIISGR